MDGCCPDWAIDDRSIARSRCYTDFTVTDLKIIWEDSALKLLNDRDRYTRNAVQEEFRTDPEKNKVTVDAATGEYCTLVSDERFAVVWWLDPGKRVATVRAVVRNPGFDPTDTDLKAHVDAAVALESKG